MHNARADKGVRLGCVWSAILGRDSMCVCGRDLVVSWYHGVDRLLGTGAYTGQFLGRYLGGRILSREAIAVHSEALVLELLQFMKVDLS